MYLLIVIIWLMLSVSPGSKGIYTNWSLLCIKYVYLCNFKNQFLAKVFIKFINTNLKNKTFIARSDLVIFVYFFSLQGAQHKKHRLENIFRTQKKPF